MMNDEFSTFKRHSAWFSQRASGAPRAAGGGLLEPARATPWDSQLPGWECAGPFNVAGRVTSLLVHPARSAPFVGRRGGGRSLEQPPMAARVGEAAGRAGPVRISARWRSTPAIRT